MVGFLLVAPPYVKMHAVQIIPGSCPGEWHVDELPPGPYSILQSGRELREQKDRMFGK